MYREESNTGIRVISEYTPLGLPAEQVVVVGGGAESYELSFSTEYNLLGQVVRREYPTQDVVHWERDSLGYPDLVENEGEGIFASSIQWNEAGSLESWATGANIITSIAYSDRTWRPTSRQVGSLGTLNYLYRDDGLLQSINGAPLVYDKLKRLMAATGPYGPGFQTQTLRYAYDTLGNILCGGESDPQADLQACPNGTQYSYAGTNPHQPSQIAGQATQFDGAGNLEAVGSDLFAYDALSQLTGASRGGVSGAFAYWGDGTMARSSVDGTVVWHAAQDFEWDLTNSVARLHVAVGGRVVATHEVPGFVPPPGQSQCGSVAPSVHWGDRIPGGPLLFLLLYGCLPLVVLRGRRVRWPDGRRAIASGTVIVFTAVVLIPAGLSVPVRADPVAMTFYYHHDHLGSVAWVSFDDGSSQRYGYDPYGRAVQGATPLFGFTGQRSEPSLGLSNYGARWYAPDLGLFLQTDPIVGARSNPYAYVDNDPMNRIDPTGMQGVGWEDAYPGQAGQTQADIIRQQQRQQRQQQREWERQLRDMQRAQQQGARELEKLLLWSANVSADFQRYIDRLERDLNAGILHPRSQSGQPGQGTSSSPFPARPESGTAANVEGFAGAFLGWYYERSTAYAIDSEGNTRVFDVRAYGGVGEAVEGGLFIGRQITNAPNVDALGGQSSSVGFSGGYLAYEGSVEFNIGPGYRGVTVTGGAAGGLAPVEFHGVIEIWTPRPR